MLRQYFCFFVYQNHLSLLQPQGGLRCFLTAWASLCRVFYANWQQKGVRKPNPKWGLPANQYCTQPWCMQVHNTVNPTNSEPIPNTPQSTNMVRRLILLNFQNIKCWNYVFEPGALLFWNAVAIATDMMCGNNHWIITPNLARSIQSILLEHILPSTVGRKNFAEENFTQ